MKLLNAFLFSLIIVSCSSEAYDNNSNTETDPILTASDFAPNTQGSYWIYNVENYSLDVPDMNLTSTDSVYIASVSANQYSLEANNGMGADGSMNSILGNGSLTKLDSTLEYSGALDLAVGFLSEQTPEINGLILLDLEATNGDLISSISDDFNNSIDIQGTSIPIDINYELYTTKENFYASKLINEMEYTNVYEGTLNLELSVSGTFSVFGSNQTINILESQNILTTRYYYGANVGLLRAESEQGFELAAELNALISLTGGNIDLPTSATVTSVEALSTYQIN